MNNNLSGLDESGVTASDPNFTGPKDDVNSKLAQPSRTPTFQQFLDSLEPEHRKTKKLSWDSDYAARR